MTKSGIGTQQAGQQQQTATTTTTTLPTQTSSASVHTAPNSSNNTGLATASSSITTVEIPIWIADRKKWVTGISKKTTINDLIYAILKQCHLIPQPQTPTSASSSAQANQTNQTNQTASSQEMSHSSIIDQIASQYALFEYTWSLPSDTSAAEPQSNALDGETKVYKCLSRWTQLNMSSNANSAPQFMLKILECQPATSGGDTLPNTLGEPAAAANETKTTPSNPNPNANQTANTTTNSSTSFATKLLKKLGVSSNSNSSSSSSSAGGASGASSISTSTLK